MNDSPEKKLWLSVLALAGKDAYGAFDPTKSKKENYNIAEEKFQAFLKTGKSFPYMYCSPDREAISARSWFKSGRKDFREVVENCGFNPEGLRKEVLVKIQWIEELENAFKEKYSHLKTETVQKLKKKGAL